METDKSYQAKIGIEQGAERLFVREDGEFKFFDESVTGEELKYLVWSKTFQTVICNSAGVLSVVNLPSCGTVIFSIVNTAMSNGSACLTSTSAVVGTEMLLLLRGVGNNAKVHVTFSGVSVRGRLASNDLSSIELYGSTNSTASMKMVCTGSSEWSVMEGNESVVENAES